MLWRQMLIVPTKSFIKNYIKRHFLLRRYEVCINIHQMYSQIGSEYENKSLMKIQ
jgi:hypothetical protein